MIEINLLPESMRKKAGGLRLEKNLLLPLGVLGGIIVILLAITVLQQVTLSSLRKRTEAAGAESLQYTKELEEVRRLESLKLELRRRMEAAKRMDSGRQLWVQILEDLSFRLPSYVWLTLLEEPKAEKLAAQVQVEATPPKSVIHGYALSLNGLATFLNRLKGSPFFKGLELSYIKIEELEAKSKVYSFGLRFELFSGVVEIPPEGT